MQNHDLKFSIPDNSIYDLVENSIFTSLQHYSNVHRGSGHFSMISTMLYEEARSITLNALSADKSYAVIFCSPYRASELVRNLDQGCYKMISSHQLGLNIGLRAVAVKKKSLRSCGRVQSGGGTTMLVSADRIAWAGAPDRFEAGTPAIINVIAFARTLQLMQIENNEASRIKDRAAEKTFIPDQDLTGITGLPLLEILKNSVIGRDIMVPVRNGTASYINLDYAASTPALFPVWKAYSRALSSESAKNIELISVTRAVISQMLNAPAEKYDIVFTSNTTESINIVAEGTEASQVLVSVLEHNSDDLPWRAQHNVLRLQADKEGFIDPAKLKNMLAVNPEIKMLALSGASNVIGSCNDIAEISSIAHRHGVKILIDAAQLVAHRRIDMDSCETDFLVFSGHKTYAPFGTGVLIARKGLLNFTHEKWNEIKSSGEENVAGIAALGESLMLLQRTGIELIMNEEQVLLRKAIEGLSGIEGIRIFGINDPERLDKRMGVLSFFIKKVWPDKIAQGLAEEGIGIRYGCHCAHILVKKILNVSPSLEKFQFVIARVFKKVRFPGVARISFGIGTTDADISACIRVLKEMSDGKRSDPGAGINKRMEEHRQAVRQKVFGA